MSSQHGSEPSAALALGTLVGGRFLLEHHRASDALGQLLLARDQKTNKPIAVRLLAPAFSEDAAAFEAIRNEVRAAAKLKHRSLVATYGIGTHAGHHFIACEWVEGTPLSEFIARQEGGTPLSLRAVYNLVAHVCKALSALHETTCHGALRPSAVFITKSGRVKVGELGLSLALANSGRFRLLDGHSQIYIAPEVVAGQPATAASDVFGVGALLYALLTGNAPVAARVSPSSVHPDASGGIDALVERCLAADPGARYPNANAVSAALLPLVAGTPELAPGGGDFGVDLEIDVDIAASIAPPPQRPRGLPTPPAVGAPARPAPAKAPPAAAGRVSPAPAHALPFDPLAAKPFAPAAPPPAAPRASAPGGPAPIEPPAAAPPAPPQMSAEDEIAALTAKLTERDAPRWMAVKGGLDHGPFTARELIKLIVDGEILDSHGLLNMTTGERKPLSEWTDFGPFVDQYKLRKAEVDHKVALEKSNRTERKSNAFKFVLLSGAIAAAVIGVGTFVMSRQAATKRDSQGYDLATFESGKVKISGTAGILKVPARRSGGGGAKRSSGDGSGFASYDDAMNQAMELGDATQGGGERQLRASDVEGVMNRKLNSLFSCVSQELRGGGRLGTVQIDLAILGSGQVMGASVSTGSPAFKKCIGGKVRQISFPPFPAPRMGARYSFGVN